MTLAKENKDIFDNASRPLTSREIFAGDDDLYKILDAPANTPSTAKTYPAAASSKKRLSIITIAIRVSIGLIAVMLLVPISLYCISAMLAPRHHASEESAAVIHTPSVAEQSAAPAALPSDEPISWKLAQSYYQKKDYIRASATYSKLSESLSLSDPAQALWDGYLKLKLALCAYKLKETAAAEIYFTKATQSSCPATAALASYYLAFIKNEQKQYPEARTSAYKALALLETIEPKYSESLISDCCFLVAQALTADALLGRNHTFESPANWPQITFNEPLEQFDEGKLQHLLQSSIETLHSAAMGPQIQKLDPRGGSIRYIAKCSGASIEELFAAFTTGGSQDIRWQFPNEKVRSRPVMLYLSSTTSQRFFETASGSIGLLASFEGDQTLIHDLGNTLSVAEHQKLLIAEAISAWQRFILSYRTDNRLADAHFAIGLLQQADNHLPTAISEFRQVANRFMRSGLAAYSLLNAAQIKIDMQDASGAREYLKELSAQYPDSPVADKANLLLAQTSLTVGDYEYAQQIFRKVCNLNISPDYTLAGTLGAAKCYFALKDYSSAADWLIRYATLAKKTPNAEADLRTAYTMLAEANVQLGNLDEAGRAYQSSLSLTSTAGDQFEVVMKLAAVYLRQENFVDALDTIEKIDLSQLSDRQLARVWLTKAQVLDAMNLTEQAAELLTDRINTVDDARIRSEMALQLARSQTKLNNVGAARDTLCQALLRSEPGVLTAQLQCELADICVKLGDNKQAVTICSQILASSVPDELHKRARVILGTAHANQKHYDKAAKAFSGSTQTAGAKPL